MKSISFVVPCYNEEKNLEATLVNILKLLKIIKIKKYELIFINDASTDKSHFVIKKLKIKHKNIVYIKNNKNFGLGYSIKLGVLKAKNDFILFVPGDNEHDYNGLIPLFKRFGDYKITIPYIINKRARSRFRRILSAIYTFMLNFIFKKNIPYFNGLVLYEKKIIQDVQLEIKNFSFSYLAESLIRCLDKCNNYQIVGYKIRNQKNRGSNALKLRNIFYSLYFIFKFRFKFK